MGEQRKESNPLLPAILTAGISAFGDLQTAAGKSEEGLFLKTMAPMFAYTAAGQLVWAQCQAERAAGAIRRIFTRAEHEGIVAELEEASDLLEKGIPLISNEPSADKRRMIEDIIINGARRAREYGALVQAQEVLDDIKRLTPSQAVVFAAVCSELQGPYADPNHGIPRPMGDHWGLPAFRLGTAINSLNFVVDFKLLVIHTPNSREHIDLSPHGRVLAEWICANPAADLDTASEQ